MAFDRNNPTHLTQLKDEVTNDPLGMGYNPDGNTNQLLRLLNDPDNNVGTETIGKLLTVELLHDALVPQDIDSAQVTDGERRYLESFLCREFEINIERFRTKIRALFQSNSATVTNLDAQTRKKSRAEVLFGVDTIIEPGDWYIARDSV